MPTICEFILKMHVHFTLSYLKYITKAFMSKFANDVNSVSEKFTLRLYWKNNFYDKARYKQASKRRLCSHLYVGWNQRLLKLDV
ncbi:hypothetical protein T4B_2840 [Trichinella pseudospiralis]|uniref:Uncharacterized protein n=1 Tax=Trichinella pseudospiralis TaxID=6337 RepID=A0A0V1IG06_TRIPS|nr:hypothetical protein T4B_2840 [Trichinella pseudospiralis]KRZ41580.1 hypothetical protein T4C_7170 [Trichinella pseudospiralis]